MSHDIFCSTSSIILQQQWIKMSNHIISPVSNHWRFFVQNRNCPFQFICISAVRKEFLQSVLIVWYFLVLYGLARYCMVFHAEILHEYWLDDIIWLILVGSFDRNYIYMEWQRESFPRVCVDPGSSWQPGSGSPVTASQSPHHWPLLNLILITSRRYRTWEITS